MRTLRSNSRRERQQVQHIKEEHIKQVHKALRLTSMCNESKTSTKLLDQKEFLCLFDLIPSKHPNGFNGQIERCSSKNARHTAKIVRSIRDIRGSRQQSKKLISQKDNNNQTTTKNIEDQLKCQRRFEFFTELETKVAAENGTRETLLAKKCSLLTEMKDVIADKRKSDILYEQERQKNIIYQIMFNELIRKIVHICK